MPAKGQSRQQAQRAMRQEEYRELLSKQGHLQHVIDICEELNDLTVQLEPIEFQRKSKVIDTKLKLISKYCPDLKNTEITGDAGSSLTIKVTDYSGELSSD